MAGWIRPGGIVKAALILFWAVMLALLVQRVQLVPEAPLDETELADSETWMSVLFKGQKIGYSYQALTRIEDGYIVDQKSFMRLKLMGAVQEVRTITTARLSRSLGLRTFNFFMSAGPIRYQLFGRLSGLDLELTGLTGGHRSQTTLRLENVPKMAAGLMPFLTQKGLETGQRFSVPIFDPATLSTKSVLAVVEDRETIVFEGKPLLVFRVRLDYFDAQSYTWVDESGRTIKEEGLLGLSLVRTTADQAQEGLAGRAELSDVIQATSAPADRTLERPRDLAYLKARLKGLDLTGFELDGGRQRLEGDVIEVVRERIDVRDQGRLPFTDPGLLMYLKPEEFVESSDRGIIAQARQLAGGLTSPLEIVDAVTGWVYENLEKRPTMSIPSAVQVLDSKVGDCNEHAVLAAALLRAAGVPARIAVGVLYFEGRFYYHAWIEAFWGRWLALDPLLGQVPADAAHIRFITGGISRQADLVRLIGRLEVQILEAR
ncbi:MAG: transglutaminase-like domain-containing protein [Thermodesulfobacteriota bacterium]